MTSFWKRLLGRPDDAAEKRAESEELESPAERRLSDDGVEGVAANELAEERLGGFNPASLVDDEFKP